MKTVTLAAVFVTLSGLFSVTASGQTNRSQFDQERLTDRCAGLTKITDKGDLYIRAFEFLRVANEIDIANHMIEVSRKNKSQRNCWISHLSGTGNYGDNNLIGKTILRLNGIGPGESYRVSVTEKKCETDEEFARGQQFWSDVVKQEYVSIASWKSRLQEIEGQLKRDHDLLSLKVLYAYDLFNGFETYKDFATQVTSQENPFDVQLERDMTVQRDSFCQMARASRGGVVPP